jgi:3-dehydroquinate dehydratase type I
VRCKVCVTLAAKDQLEALDQIGNAEDLGADLIEVRFDFMEEVGDLRDIATSTSIPLIATNRLIDQGGMKQVIEVDRVNVLLKAASVGFDYVDLELTMPALSPTLQQLKELGAEVIVSDHDFEGTPPLTSLKEKMDKMIAVGVDICKLIPMAKRASDNLNCFNLIREKRGQTRIVCFAMGEMGILSRVLSPVLGAEFTYASLLPSRETAPGQLTLQELREIYSAMGFG